MICTYSITFFSLLLIKILKFHRANVLLGWKLQLLVCPDSGGRNTLGACFANSGKMSCCDGLRWLCKGFVMNVQLSGLRKYWSIIQVPCGCQCFATHPLAFWQNFTETIWAILETQGSRNGRQKKMVRPNPLPHLFTKMTYGGIAWRKIMYVQRYDTKGYRYLRRSQRLSCLYNLWKPVPVPYLILLPNFLRWLIWRWVAWGFRTQRWCLSCSLVSSWHTDFLSDREPANLPSSQRPCNQNYICWKCMKSYENACKSPAQLWNHESQPFTF